MTSIELNPKETLTLIEALEYLTDLDTERVGMDKRVWHVELNMKEPSWARC